MRNKQQPDLATENAMLLEQHARLYQEHVNTKRELREAKELFEMAVRNIEKTSGARHIGNLNFQRIKAQDVSILNKQQSNCFWVNRKGEARDYDSVVMGMV